MIFTLDNLLDLKELKGIISSLASAPFTDGKLTAGWHAKSVKHNQQIQKESPIAESIYKQVRSKLAHHPLFQAASYPKSIHTLLISRYETGMSYGRHVDNALMGQGKHRSDISFTIFLSPPDDYEGGELCIEQSDGDRQYKLPAGSVILYPSSTLHEVCEVTAGTRLVIVGWVESFIRDPAQRELLFDLDTVKRSLFQQQGKTLEFDLIAKTHSNLLRQWSE